MKFVDGNVFNWFLSVFMWYLHTFPDTSFRIIVISWMICRNRPRWSSFARSATRGGQGGGESRPLQWCDDKINEHMDPQIIQFSKVFHYKPSIFGNPHIMSWSWPSFVALSTTIQLFGFQMLECPGRDSTQSCAENTTKGRFARACGSTRPGGPGEWLFVLDGWTGRATGASMDLFVGRKMGGNVRVSIAAMYW